MAWTTPRTWVTGELVTASIMNTHVRDNENALAGIGGLVASSGTITSGSGFSVNHSATGTYDVTFTVAFVAAPLVQITEVGTANLFAGITTGPATTGFTAKFRNTSSADTDAAFSFLARTVA